MRRITLLSALLFPLQRFYHAQRGGIMVEFIIALLPFILMMLFIIDIGRIYAVSAIIDLSITEAAKYAKNSSNINDAVDHYKTIFEEQAKNHIFNMLINKKNYINPRVDFASDIQGLLKLLNN